MPHDALYLHFPYCVTKCFYCDFNSHVDSTANHETYLTCLLVEARHRATQLRPTTIFFGGGTPSLASPATLSSFLAELAQTIDLSQMEEFTVELNPESVTSELLQTLRQHRVTRLSIGVQALDPQTLAFFGRAHDVESARNAFRTVRASGFDNVNIDLIMGAPPQPIPTWQQGVREILEWSPEHVSLYDLIYEPGTTLSSMKTRGKLSPRPSDEQARLFIWNQRTLRRAGYRPYEVSAFARDGKQCLHNLVYWRNEPYIGLGAGAASYQRGYRSKNIEDPRAYITSIQRTGLASHTSECLDRRARIAETLMMRFRLREAIRLSELATSSECSYLLPTLQNLRDQGLLIHEHGTIQLTARGRRLTDSIVAAVLQAST